jgi:hypothetical protein
MQSHSYVIRRHVPVDAARFRRAASWRGQRGSERLHLHFKAGDQSPKKQRSRESGVSTPKRPDLYAERAAAIPTATPFKLIGTF